MTAAERYNLSIYIAPQTAHAPDVVERVLWHCSDDRELALAVIKHADERGIDPIYLARVTKDFSR